VGNVGDVNAEGEQQARGRDRLLIRSEIIPAPAATVTSGRRWAAVNFSTTGSMVVVSALLPSNAEIVSRGPVLAG
jgi:hypothetical protein